MVIENLIKSLVEIQAQHPGINVAIFDHRKNLGDDCGDGSHAGIYQVSEPIVMDITETDEREFYKEQHDGNDFTPWLALFFDNEDYDLNGVLVAELSACPECGNPYPHLHRGGGYSCEDCGHEW